jgi:hypothetical protein
LNTATEIGIVRAHNNWPARLAAFLTLSQSFEYTNGNLVEKPNHDGNDGKRRAIVPENGDNVCWVCVYKRFNKRMENARSSDYLIV